jgi:hypothetical protein
LDTLSLHDALPISPRQFSRNVYNTGNYVYNGIDRIDSSIGYVIENCISCCGRCNVAKMSESQQDFLSWIDRVYSHIHSLESSINQSENNFEI